MNEEIIIPIQEEVDNKEVLNESAEKLAVIASKLSEIFKSGFDAGFIGQKTKALLEAYKQDTIAYIDRQIDHILTGKDSDGVLETIAEISAALNNDSNAFATLVAKINEAKSTSVPSKKNVYNSSSIRLYGFKSGEDTVTSPRSNTSASEAKGTNAELLSKEVEDKALGKDENGEYKKVSLYKATVMSRDSMGRSSIITDDSPLPKHIINKEYADKTYIAKSKKRPGEGLTPLLYGINSEGDAVINGLSLTTYEPTNAEKPNEAGPEGSEGLREDLYYSTIMSRDSNGRSSVIGPRHPKHIANKEYVDAEVARGTGDAAQYAYYLSQDDKKYAASVAAMAESNAKAHADTVAATAESNAKAHADSLFLEVNSTPDTEMSDTSTNPVQNKVIKNYVDALIADITYVSASIKSFALDGVYDSVGIEMTYTEVGHTIYSVVLKWSLAGSIKALSLTGTGISGEITDKTLTTKTISGLSITANSSGSWTLTVTGEKGETAKKTIYSPTFQRRIYYGTSYSDSLDATGVTALLNFPALNRKYSWSASSSTNEYIYYCVPVSFGEVSFTAGGFEGGFNPATTVSITSHTGYIEDYYVYRSTEKIKGYITVTAS